jgi:hypothetical protein
MPFRIRGGLIASGFRLVVSGFLRDVAVLSTLRFTTGELRIESGSRPMFCRHFKVLL